MIRMKWIFSLSILLLPFVTFSQNGTTLEEYRYLSKGYAYQLEMGLDAHKEGYTIQKLFRSQNDVQFIGLYKRSQPQLRGLLAILNVSTPQPKYLCIPNEMTEELVRNQYKYDKQQLLISSATRTQFEDALTGLLLRSLDQPPSSLPRSGQREELVSKGAPVSKIELTSKGIPINQQPVYERQKASEFQERSISAEMDFTAAEESAPQKSLSAQIGGDLLDRTLLRSPKITEAHRNKGKVVIKVCVSQSGEVISARFTQKGSTTLAAELKQIAIRNARSIQFGESHLSEQCGIIAYHFR